MKNQYFGDINDYKKYGLLRCIRKTTNLDISIAWMLTPDDKSTDGKFTSYLSSPEKWRHYDPELFDSLASMLSQGGKRHVGLAHEFELLPNAGYFDKVVPDNANQRDAWFDELLNFSEPTDFVFLDPDNGLEVKSKAYGKAKSSKYLYWHELETLWGKGKSVLVYQHFVREKRPAFIQRMLSGIQERAPTSLVCAFSTANVVFLLALQPEHQKYYQAIQQSVEKRWGHKIKHWELKTYSFEVPKRETDKRQAASHQGLTDELITKFRDKVNEHGFAYFYYSNKNGKNYWNPICSCMDWISVAIRSIINAEPLSQDIDVRSMQMYSLISSVDLVSEAVMSLYSILNGENGRIPPFKGDYSIFERRDGLDDDAYFKHIRACFGAHPVNINLDAGQKRFFASWPHESDFESGELKVLLYSNEVGEPDRSLALKKKELLRYLEKRYFFLDELTKVIDLRKKAFASDLAKQPIESVRDPLKQLKILTRESARRLNNDYLNQLLNELTYIFTASIDIPKHQEFESRFKDELQPLILEIHDVLQNCQFDFELANAHLLGMDNLYNEFSYELPKLSACLYSSRSDTLIDYYFKRLRSADKWGFDLSPIDEPAQSILKLHLLNRAIAERRPTI